MGERGLHPPSSAWYRKPLTVVTMLENAVLVARRCYMRERGPHPPSSVWYRKPLMEVRSWSSCFRAACMRSKLVGFHTNSTRNPTVQSSGTSCAHRHDTVQNA